MENENEAVVVDTTNNEAEGSTETESVTLKKEEYEKLNQTLGSLKRELKDFKKAKEETKETANQTKPDENALLQRLEKMSLRQNGITDPEDIELAQKTAKKWGVDIDEVLADEDFRVKLERQQTARDNVKATANIRGGAGNSQAKNTPEYWQAKGTPPTPADVPDRKTRQAIVNKMMKAGENSDGGFYNQ